MSTERLKELEKSNGVTWQQVIREGNWVVYKHISTEAPSDQKFVGRGYEIFKVRMRPARKVKGVLIPAKECFPKTDDWGTNAFTYTQENNALECFRRRKLL